ncbi:MFS transporter [Cupriavidus basilensis]
MNNSIDGGQLADAALTPAQAKAWWMVLVATVGVAVCSTPIIFMTVGIFIRPLGTAMGWDRAQVTTSLSIAALALGLSSPYIGALLDRLPVRRVLSASLFLYGATVMLLPTLAARAGLPGYYLGFMLIGILSAGSNTMVYLRVVSAWFDKSRGLALGISMAGVALGGAVAAPLAAIIVQKYGWQAGYYMLGLLPIVIGIPLALFVLQEAPSANDRYSQMSPATVGVTRTHALGMRAFWLIIFSAFLMAASINGAQVHLVSMLMDRGVTLATASLATTVLAVFALMGRVGAGYLFDRVFAPYAAISIFALSCIGCLGLLAFQSTLAVYFCAALLGLGAGAESDLLGYLVSRYFGIKHFGQIFGWVFAAFMIGTAIGPVVFGIGFDLAQSYATPLIGAALSLLCVCILCALMPRFKQYSNMH